MNEFIAVYKPSEQRPDEPLLIGLANCKCRATIEAAKRLLSQLDAAIREAEIMADSETSK